MPDKPEKPPIERALDLFVYTPLGLALFARDIVTGAAERGRTEVEQARKRTESQLTQWRVVGQYAVDTELKPRVSSLQQTIEGLIVRRPTTPASGSHPAASSTGPSGNGSTAAPSTPVVDYAAERAAAAELAIPDYDELSASQVVERLSGLTSSELDAVRAYEAARRNRKTILHRIDQLAH